MCSDEWWRQVCTDTENFSFGESDWTDSINHIAYAPYQYKLDAVALAYSRLTREQKDETERLLEPTVG